jgi:DNA repair exonuclease SbcCD ATPase subunit
MSTASDSAADPAPRKTGKYRDRILTEADRYKDGRIGQSEFLYRVDDVIAEIDEQEMERIATLKDRLSRAENGMGEAVVQWNRLEAENQKLRETLEKVGRNSAHLRNENAELSESVERLSENVARVAALEARLQTAELRRAEIGAQRDALADAVHGLPVSEFMESFTSVRDAADLYAKSARFEAENQHLRQALRDVRAFFVASHVHGLPLSRLDEALMMVSPREGQ